ncbi:MAG: DNA polymerase/3'-5' exonuclease PolX [bacterium]
MLFTNAQVAETLNEHSAALEAVGADFFKIRAYRQSAESIANTADDVYQVWQEGALESIQGVGKSIAGHLQELFAKGKIAEFEKLKRRVPKGMFALLKIPGIGSKKAYALAKELDIASVSGLKKAITANKVAGLTGFGVASQLNLKKAIADWESLEDRLLLSNALAVAEEYLAYLKKNPAVLEAEVLGSIRRRSPTVGDIDIAVATNNLSEALTHFTTYPKVQKVVNQGDIKATVILKNGLQIDIMTTPPKSWGALLQHFTGSKEHNIHLRIVAKSQGLKLSEKLPVKSEAAVYQKLKMQFIPPEMREDTGEIELALKNEIPRLLDISDIKGDLQMHTQYSDGLNTVAEIAARAHSLSYQYIAMTDHILSLNTNPRAKVLAWVEQRKKEFVKAEQKYPKLKIINGVEVNIPASGGLALPHEILSQFGLVIVSIHSGFRKSGGEQTQRILEALSNPFVHVLGHPTGRVLLQRPAIEADWDAIFKKAAKLGKYLEINAHPNRLDLSGHLIRRAKQLGVKFTLGTDAHLVDHLDNMKYGVYMARRGWLTRKDVVNTLGYDSLVKCLNRRK